MEWLKEETHNQKVVSSNPGVRYWIDIFTLICCKIWNFWLKRPKINSKEAEDGPFKKTFGEMNFGTLLASAKTTWIFFFRECFIATLRHSLQLSELGNSIEELSVT